MDKFERVNLVTNVLNGAYNAALVECGDDSDDFNELRAETQVFLLSLQEQIFKLLDVTIEDFAIDLDPGKFIFDE